MSNRNYNASLITQLKSQRAASATVHQLGMFQRTSTDSSTMLSIRQGQITQYLQGRGCVNVYPGCPCTTASGQPISLPGEVSGITYTLGSIIVSWIPPTRGDGPFTYVVTPYKNGIIQSPIRTGNTFYRFTDLDEGQSYTFSVCAVNAAGSGNTTVAPTSMFAPPSGLSAVLSPSALVDSPDPSMSYILQTSLDILLSYLAAANLGPTRGSRLLYLWAATVAGAWNWVDPAVHLQNTHDGWNWSQKAPVVLSSTDALVWLCGVMDYITPYFVPGAYRSPYPCSAERAQSVKQRAAWDTWSAAWYAWYQSRQADGNSAATTTQPTSSANWGQTLVVDGVTVNPIAGYPQPQQWTKLQVQGRTQGYLTYNWDDVRSTGLTEGQEATVQAAVQPATGAARDTEIDQVRTMAANLTDDQKMIAEFWAGGPGTVAPPAMMVWLWKEYTRALCLQRAITCNTMIYSLLDLAIHLFEGGRVTWRLKKAWIESRPIQEIRRRYAGQQIVSWNGTVDGAQWVPYQAANFVTPPFADFPSGHSHFSKAFSLTMSRWFGPTIQANPVVYDSLNMMSPMFRGVAPATRLFGTFICPTGASEVQPGVVPAAPITLTFSTWEAMATSSGMSRLYGGIHALTAHQASQTVATLVDGYLQTSWGISTSPLHLTVFPEVLPLPQADPVQTQTDTQTTTNPVQTQTQTVPVQTDTQTSTTTSTTTDSVQTQTQTQTTTTTVMDPVQTQTVTTPYLIQVNYLSDKPDATVQQYVQQAVQIIQSLIAQSHGLRLPQVSTEYDMVIDMDLQSLASGVLATATPTVVNTSAAYPMPVRQRVTLNRNATGLQAQANFNGSTVPQLLPVLVHEMLHGLGIGSIALQGIDVGWDRFLDATKTWYTGPAAVAAYRTIVGTAVQRIPVENSFGSGTAYSHWEEGLTGTFQKEKRMYDYGTGPIYHPALPSELMTGVAGPAFYLTDVTVGALKDYGYVVNESSPNIVPYPAGLIESA